MVIIARDPFCYRCYQRISKCHEATHRKLQNVQESLRSPLPRLQVLSKSDLERVAPGIARVAGSNDVFCAE
jgi:hypothetical protein